MSLNLTIAVIGSQGMLGSQLVHLLRSVPEIRPSAYDLPEVDIRTPTTFSRLLKHDHLDWVVNCAAYTNVDACETHMSEAFAVNADGVENLALFCRTHQIRMVHFSTDYVFDGKKESAYLETDPPNPINVYGKSKLEGERRLLQILPETCTILRTAWLYGPNGKHFVDTITNLARQQSQLRVVNDQFGGPTFTRDLAQITWAVIQKNLTGIFHVTNGGRTSWYEFAREILKFRGLATPISPISSEAFSRPAKRPTNSTLNLTKIESALETKIRHWKDALEEFCSLNTNAPSTGSHRAD